MTTPPARQYNLPELSSATLHVAVREQVARDAAPKWSVLGPVLAPALLLIVGACLGFFFTLDAAIATERLVGLIGVSILAVLAALGLQRVERTAPLLLAVALVALLGAGWVIAATGADVFRGSVGTLLQIVLRPLFGLARVTDSVDVANTRFIVGYNGLADLCLVAMVCCGALLLERPARGRAVLLSTIGSIALVLLVGAGSRGGLTGLAAAICAIGLLLWPRRYALLTLVAAPMAIVLAAVGIFDKGLEYSSTAGRLTYWSDLARLLVEYPLTGVGLGVDTANRVALQYEINPDPERIFYAHNTFVQTYLEQGPVGTAGMLLVPIIAVSAALAARRYGVEQPRKALLIAGLGTIGALEAHGLTDQVVTTNVGTGLLLLGLVAVLAGVSAAARESLGSSLRRLGLVVGGLAAIGVLAFAALPAGRAQVLLDLGGLRLNQALAMDTQAPGRAPALAEAEATLSSALIHDPGQPAVLRELARARAAQFDDRGALDALKKAADSPRLDAFDRLQIAHVYRDLGFAQEAYTWAAAAYTAWGRPPEDAVTSAYAQSTLADSRARNLADQAEAAMRARSFGQAHSLFAQALTFEPGNAYLQDRLGASERAVARYGAGSP